MCNHNFLFFTSPSQVHFGINDTVFALSHSPLPGAFDLLVYTDKDLEVPDKWEESGPQMIDQSETVRLRSFTTSIHEVKSMVAYKVNS